WVTRHLAKVGVAVSNPVVRSKQVLVRVRFFDLMSESTGAQRTRSPHFPLSSLRCRPERRIKRGCQLGLLLLEEVPVAIRGGADRGVAEVILDLVQAPPVGDQERCA